MAERCPDQLFIVRSHQTPLCPASHTHTNPHNSTTHQTDGLREDEERSEMEGREREEGGIENEREIRRAKE